MLNEKRLIEEYNKYYNHLGNYYPYTSKDDKKQLHLKLDSILKNTATANIDVVGIIEILNKSYLLGDRTLVKGVQRKTWMIPFEDLSQEKLCDYYSQIPKHGNQLEDAQEIAAKLKEALKKELKAYLKGKKKIGILLSGGLDSRIVAGLIQELQIEKQYNGKVCAMTWGIKQSRDVIYAKDICKKYDWEFIHLGLNAEVLRENIYIAGKMGAEFSPLHLHAMNRIKDIENIDAVIAGSYGDGIGRGEFSGTKVKKLPKFISKQLNPYGILKQKAVEKYKQEVIEDAFGYRNYIKRDKEYQYREIEQEVHYMRRKLQACMNIIGSKIPLYQLFTSPEVVSLMWSFDVSIRNDAIYQHLIATLPGGVDKIPWARNGKPIVEDSEVNIDHGTKQHHKYGIWLRKELQDEIHNLVFSKEIRNLDIFNIDALERLFDIWKSSETITVNRLDEIFSWLASLAVFVKEYNIQSEERFERSITDAVNVTKGVIQANILTILRGKLRE